MSDLKVDVIFIVDTTGSMGVFIDTARKQLVNSILNIQRTGVDLTCSLIVYRDHPPQDYTFASKILCNAKAPKDIHDKMQTSRDFTPDGGGDMPESGLDAIADIAKLKLRENSLRYAFLIGDAPLHGAYGKTACACGLRAHDIYPILEQCSTTLIGVPTNAHNATLNSFNRVCSEVHKIGRTVDSLATITTELTRVQANAQWAIGKVLPVLEKDPFIIMSDLCDTVGSDTRRVADSIEILNTLGHTQQFT